MMLKRAESFRSALAAARGRIEGAMIRDERRDAGRQFRRARHGHAP